jgi:hypothetical protein
MSSSALAWLSDALDGGGNSDSGGDSSGDITLGSGGSPDSGSWWDSIVNFVEAPFQATQNFFAGLENTIWLAVIVIAVLVIVIVLALGYAPNVKHIVPHFV